MCKAALRKPTAMPRRTESNKLKTGFNPEFIIRRDMIAAKGKRVSTDISATFSIRYVMKTPKAKIAQIKPWVGTSVDKNCNIADQFMIRQPSEN